MGKVLLIILCLFFPFIAILIHDGPCMKVVWAFGAQCTILAPASWCCPVPANATESVSPLACSPIR